ncbi:MAG: hypothetical protein P857_298 [Candidatus Xenolissoclinum pacificiensis L6]|uniref:Uncharacterized protein n=1 Tax=Candidatus Xenolissoclinum pacificiensis L6 TaxID=1401685 RepID=W2V1R3_9RICK|nr:MAG: hypothetical protein P857_298 [Candidatus Xenolissoclinum pacificiensis L6]
MEESNMEIVNNMDVIECLNIVEHHLIDIVPDQIFQGFEEDDSMTISMDLLVYIDGYDISDQVAEYVYLDDETAVDDKYTLEGAIRLHVDCMSVHKVMEILSKIELDYQGNEVMLSGHVLRNQSSSGMMISNMMYIVIDDWDQLTEYGINSTVNFNGLVLNI